ncbi:MAG: carboxypeptidase-like regulatory domain-containing protein [Acidobacteriota bacterium]
MSFHLVAEDDWNAGRLGPEHFLPDGEVFLYRVGTFEPAIVGPLNEKLEVPPGEWSWIAEGPGYVSVLAGVLPVTEEGAASERLVWHAVPACQVRVEEATDFRRLTRLDLVSLDHGAVYPLVPGVREQAWVPAGKILAYGVTVRGLDGIASPRRCPAGAAISFGVPSPPPPGRQSLMGTALLPEDSENKPVDRAALMAAFVSRDAALPTLPTAAAWSPGRVTLFFLDVEATAGWIGLEHPELRTERLLVEGREGEAWELPATQLRERATLTLRVDYRPRREHPSGRLHLYRCGLRRGDRASLHHRACRELPLTRELIRGLHEYTFPGLDHGQYSVDAVIGDDRVRGLGNKVFPYLSADDDAFPASEPVPLWELEIYGEITEDSEPVAGEVRIEGTLTGVTRRRVFPTGDDGFYRLLYFGEVADIFDLKRSALPEDLRDRPAAERMGLFSMSDHLQVCDAAGRCRVFHISSALLGEGRLDFELGSARALEVRVEDAMTGEPLEGAMVSYRPPSPALRFRDGRARYVEPEDGHAVAMHTDADGRLALRGLPGKPLDLAVLRDGYRPSGRRGLVVPPETPVRLTIELEADERQGATDLVLQDGRELGRAAILVYDENGVWDRRCSRMANGRGRVELPGLCGEEAVAIVVHPRAATTLLPPGALSGTGRIEIAAAPDPPLLLRVKNSDGGPLAGAPVAVSLGVATLGPDEQVFAATGHGSVVYLRTDAEGEVILQGVDPNGAVAPQVTVAGENHSLGTHAAGDVVELVID